MESDAEKIRGDGRTGASGCVPTANKREHNSMTMRREPRKRCLWVRGCVRVRHMLDKKRSILCCIGTGTGTSGGNVVLATRRTLLSSATRFDTNQQRAHPYGTGRTPDSATRGNPHSRMKL
jgi:hypothetical protein